jgi:hypothetical protein
MGFISRHVPFSLFSFLFISLSPYLLISRSLDLPIFYSERRTPNSELFLIPYLLISSSPHLSFFSIPRLALFPRLPIPPSLDLPIFYSERRTARLSSPKSPNSELFLIPYLPIPSSPHLPIFLFPLTAHSSRCYFYYSKLGCLYRDK